jgi:hypothetical protein
MFVYHYRLYDRFRKPVASLALLADEQESWRPESFHYDLFGCRMGLHYPVAKLLDWAGSQARLADSTNPFAIVTQAHLATRATRNDPQSRYEAKWTLVKDLYRRGWTRQQVIDLLKILDWMMRLPKELALELRHNLSTLEEEMNKPYVTSFERLAIEQGMEQGMAQGIERGLAQGMEQGLERGLKQGIEQGIEQGRQQGQAQVLAQLLASRFGPLPWWARTRVEKATEIELNAWAKVVLSADSLDAVLGMKIR